MKKSELQAIIREEIRLAEASLTQKEFQTKGLGAWVVDAIEYIEKAQKELKSTALVSKNRDFKKFIGQLDTVIGDLSDYMDKNYNTSKWDYTRGK